MKPWWPIDSVIVFFLIALFVSAGLLYQAAGDHRDAQRYPPPGHVVSVPSGAQLHVHAEGRATSPTVVFESGISGSCLSWATVQPLVANFAHAISYDRAGLGWSGGTLTPRTIDNMAAELAAALDAEQIAQPYVLVGHSFGGLLVQTFAHTYPSRVAAIVMIDPVTQSGWAQADAREMQRLQMGARLSRRGAWLARFGVVRAALSLLMAGGTLLPKTIARASAGQGNSAIQRLISEVQKLPPQKQPIVAAQWSRARSFRAMASYLECLPTSARQALDRPAPAAIPLVVLSAESSTDAEQAERQAWVAGRLNSHHERIPGTGHWLQLERPELVAAVIRDVLLRVR